MMGDHGEPPEEGATWVESYERAGVSVSGYWRGKDGRRIDPSKIEAAGSAGTSPSPLNKKLLSYSVNSDVDGGQEATDRPGDHDTIDEPGHTGWLTDSMAACTDDDIDEEYENWLVENGDFYNTSDVPGKPSPYTVWPENIDMPIYNVGPYHVSLDNLEDESDEESLMLSATRLGRDQYNDPIDDDKYSSMSNDEWDHVLSTPELRAEAVKYAEENNLVSRDEYSSDRVIEKVADGYLDL
jgi:hypothetical protein